MTARGRLAAPTPSRLTLSARWDNVSMSACDNRQIKSGDGHDGAEAIRSR